MTYRVWDGVTMVKREQHLMCRLNGGSLKPANERLKVFEGYWTQELEQIKQRLQLRALERMVCLDDSSGRKKESSWQPLWGKASAYSKATQTHDARSGPTDE